MRYNRAFIYTVVLIAILVHPLYAQLRDQSGTLSKLRGVKVAVAILGDKPRSFLGHQVTPESVKKMATERLQKAGIKILSEEEFTTDKSQPLLHIHYLGTQLFQDYVSTGIIYTTHIVLIQKVTLPDGGQYPGVTYKTDSRMGVVSKESTNFAINSIMKSLSEFIAAWKTTHK